MNQQGFFIFVRLLIFKILLFMKKFLLSVIVIVMAGCYDPIEPPVEEWHNFYYEVTGTGDSFFVTYENADGNTSQNSSVKSGWRYSWKQKGTCWLYLSAQNNSDKGSVTVKIVREGVTVSSNTSYGGYSIADVSGDFY